MIKFLSKNRYKFLILILAVLVTAIICNIVNEKKKKEQYENSIIAAVETGNKYRDEKNDVNRKKFTKKLKELKKCI